MLYFLRNLLLLYILLLSNYAFSLSSSSYLVTNSAIKYFDFDDAVLQFDKYDDLSESDLHNLLLTYVNLDLLSEANLVAKKILLIDKLNQEAWIAHLSNAIDKNDLSIINTFKMNINNPEMDLVNFIFFNNKGNIKNKKLIASSIFEIVQASISESDEQASYKFILFYLSIATIMDPTFNEAYFYIAHIYQVLKKYSKAEFFYKQISSEHHLFIDSQKNIAINKSKIGLHNEGTDLLKELIENNVNNLDLIVTLADLYRTQKNYDEASKYYSIIINLKNNSFKDFWRIFYLRGICFERLKKWNLAEKDFLYSLKIKPDSSQVLNYLAYGWLERDIHINKAIKMLKDAYKANPNSSYIADSLAWAFYKNNDLIKAVNLMEKVILMAPGEAISLDHLGDIYFAMDRKREASYLWKQALDLAEPEDEITHIIKKKIEVYNEG